MTLDFYIPSDPATSAVRAIKRKFCSIDEAEEEEEVATATSTSDSSSPSTNISPHPSAPPEIALFLHNPEKTKPGQGGMCNRPLPKGAYWYPVVFRSLLRPKRNEKAAETFFRPTLAAMRGGQKGEKDVEEEGRVDLLSVRVRDLVEEERGRVEEGRKRFLGGVGA
ncbi:hypothetical protein L211DRAFT_839563 [Terfezia boudieri ATCC MYA-4762]|uniref:Uncharacterized protein n=1 Tax=Terfezia boudieri ATCC MYA-4762 TaxID=1051890 RepID=A0A3N4LHZ1_9PEZI|nr:hypothetical protein L211DRAFT_839563 [Terfezia boudieri ATCC MYA-4762]